MATVRKRGKKWQARIQRRNWRVAHSFITRADAERWAREVEIEIERGTYIKSSSQSDDVTLGDLIHRYATQVTPAKKSAVQEALRLKHWREHPLAARRANTIRSCDIAEYRDARIAKGLSGSTVRLELAALSQVFTTAAKEWGYEGLRNPVAAIRRPAPGRARDRRLRDGELQRILSACVNSELPRFIRLAIETAMRRGELVKLRWEDIDLARAIAVLHDTKNGERRAVPLSSTALAILHSMPRRIDGLVFGMSAMQVTCLFRDAVARARKRYQNECRQIGVITDDTFLTDLRLHDLRHEAVSRLFERGLNVMDVVSISGHRTLNMARRYTHLKAEELAKRLR
ncbi:MAG: site-specific integrase [Rhodospirillaceae bacterium]